MIYSSFITSKNGFSVPLFNDGIPSGSKYDPIREAQSFGDNIKAETGFFIIAGIAGGFHLCSLQKKFPAAKIICVEKDKESLQFCLTNDYLKNLNLSNIIFCVPEELERAFTSNYIPSLYGDFSFLYLRTWADRNKVLMEELFSNIQRIIKNISADYSVQCHFGKIWQRNILLNLKMIDKNKEIISFNVNEEDFEKTAAIIAAGPSLDKSIYELIQNRKKYFIFSTDTAYRSLLKHNVIPDAVVSIDGQSISSSHFYNCSKDTQFIFDLCSSSSAVKKIIDCGNNIYFISTGHPLSALASKNKYFTQINSGSGTVTIAACDFALKSGFKKIKFFGNDFCYSFGKPYTKGTYLDENFYGKANKFIPADNSFTHLMYRTETKKFISENYSYSNLKSPFTTEILDSYKNTLNEWITINGGNFCDGYFIFDKSKYIISNIQKQFDFDNFINELLALLESVNSSLNDISKIYAFLPYYAFEKSKISNKENLNVFDFLKLEYKTILRYTDNYEAK